MTDGKAELSKLLQSWKRYPVQMVLDLFGVIPDPCQAEALTHLAEKPESFEKYQEMLCLPPSWPKTIYAGDGKGNKIERELSPSLATDEYNRVAKGYEEGYFGHVSMRSGHGVGKSTTMSWALIWFMLTHYPCKVPCTAPTKHQLEDVLWAEIDKWWRRVPKYLQDQYEITRDQVIMKAAPRRAFAVARTSRREQPDALQGFHEDNILFLVDESSGVEDLVFERAEGALTTHGAKSLMAGNPTRVQGYFYESHTRLRHLWHTMKVSCLDSPRVTDEYVKSQRIRYGENSNVYRVRVLGEFPRGDDDAVIPYYMAVEAVNRPIQTTDDEPIIWGLDIAGFGDDRTALCKRKKNVILEKIRTWRNKDTMQTASLVTMEYQETPDKDKPDEIMVDSIGIGHGVVDRLRENGLPVRAINVGESSASRDIYFRLRDEIWFKGREWFEDRGCSMPEDDEFLGELCAPRYKELSTGKLQVETKSDVKRRTMVKQSPDKADAFLLTFASGKFRKRRWQKMRQRSNRELGIV